MERDVAPTGAGMMGYIITEAAGLDRRTHGRGDDGFMHAESEDDGETFSKN